MPGEVSHHLSTKAALHALDREESLTIHFNIRILRDYTQSKIPDSLSRLPEKGR